jgi:homoprotocatechuate degradation regulator HpaR
MKNICGFAVAQISCVARDGESGRVTDRPTERPADSAATSRPGGPTRVRLRSFSSSLPMMLLRARESVMRHFRASLRSHDLTEQQWRVLRALSAVGEIEVSQLARATYLLAPSLSRILKDLEARGLIDRRLDADDMRVGLVRIGTRGTELIEAVSPQSEAIYAEITARFGPERLAELQALLIELERAMATDEKGGEP